MEINVPLVIGSLPCRKIEERRQKCFIEKSTSRPLKKTISDNSQKSQQQLINCGNGYDSGKTMSVLYLQNRKERPFQLIESNEHYICSKSQLSYSNKYPYFVDLPTSSKQSRKVSMLATAMRAEANVSIRSNTSVASNGFVAKNERASSLTPVSTTAVTHCHSPKSPLAKRQLNADHSGYKLYPTLTTPEGKPRRGSAIITIVKCDDNSDTQNQQSRRQSATQSSKSNESHGSLSGLPPVETK